MMLNYFRAPKILLERSKGLSLQQLTYLQNELENLADSLRGEVMVFELATHVEVSYHLITLYLL